MKSLMVLDWVPGHPFGTLAALALLVTALPSISAAAPIDILVKDVDLLEQVGIRAWRGPETPNVQLSHYGGDPAPGGAAGDRIVGFTLFVLTRNVGTDPILWRFPVNETRAAPDPAPPNPWNVANDFSGSDPAKDSGNDIRHFHKMGFAGADAERHQVGQHPHYLFQIFRKPLAGGDIQEIGRSDLKHAYRTRPLIPHHELRRDEEDSYNPGHNRDQSFFGPFGEMGATFQVPRHDHMGSQYAGLDPANPAHFWRDHGQKAFAASPPVPADPGHPGNDNIDHLLQGKVDALRQPGFCYFCVATTFVVGDAGSGDQNSNNTFWRRFDPGWDGTKFTPTMSTTKFGNGLDNLRRDPPELTDDFSCPLDFGDAPAGYFTLFSSDGPRYAEGGLQRLGSRWDAERDGQPTLRAIGDDVSLLGGLPDPVDDEDGIVFGESFVDVTFAITREGQHRYQLRAWWDVNEDGCFEHLTADACNSASELFIDDLLTLEAGTHVRRYALEFDPRDFYSRFRLTWDPADPDVWPYAVFTSLPDPCPEPPRSCEFSHGEVEDYAPVPAPGGFVLVLAVLLGVLVSRCYPRIRLGTRSSDHWLETLFHWPREPAR